MQLKSLTAAIAVAVACSACAGSEKLEIDNPFPSKKEIVKLSAKKVAPEAVEAPDVSVVETWKLQGPLPDTMGFREHTAQNEVEQAYYSKLPAGKKIVHSEAMNCAAREIGYFVAEHRKLPYSSLKHFIFARCGTLAAGNALRFSITPGAGAKDVGGYVDQAVNLVKQLQTETKVPLDTGIWYGQIDGEAIVVHAAGKQFVDLEPTPMTVGPSGNVVLQGRVLLPKMAQISGLINRGDFGYSRCTADPSVGMPAFRIVCDVDRTDEVAYFEVMTATKSSIMAHAVLGQMVWPGGEASAVYHSPATRRALAKAKAERARLRQEQAQNDAPTAAADRSKTDGANADGAKTDDANTDNSTPEDAAQAAAGDADPTQEQPTAEAITPEPLVDSSGAASAKEYPVRFIGLLNQVREEAGMTPVEHAAAQSAAIQSIAEQFAAASRQDDEAVANKLALGIMAGWDVTGPIIDADLSSNWSSTHDPSTLLETMLETPSGRRTLMDPSRAEIALGTVERDQAVSGIVASYSFVPDEHPNRRAQRVLDALNKGREAFGSHPAQEDPKLRAKARRASRAIEHGKAGVIKARDFMLEAAAKRYHKAVYSYTFVTHSLDDIDFPKEVLQSKQLPVSVVVAPFSKKDFPWTMYAVVLVFPKQPRANIAMVDPSATDR